MSAKLVFLSGPLQGEEVPLLEGVLTIGRHPNGDLVLSDSLVSRLQATVSYENGQYLLRDEGSSNGTFVDDRKIDRQVLRDGQVIEFGMGGPSARFEG